MIRILLSIFMVQLLFAQDYGLPHYMTAEEKEQFKLYRLQQQLSKTELAEQPPVAVRTMAEWEELQGLQITWTSYYEILAQIVDHAQEEVMVYIVCSDSNQVKTYLTSKGVPLNNITYLIESYDTIWCRDYGPWSVYELDVQQLDIIDWIYNRPRANDDAIPVAVAAYLGNDLYEAIQDPDDLVHTGGNFMVDGHGTGFASNLILEENTDKTEPEIDDIAQRYLGLNRFIKMETLPYDEIHHIDMHMKLLDEETLLVGEYPSGVADGPQIETNLQYVLNNYQTCFGRDFQVVRIPMPPDGHGRYPDAGGDYRTYTNSVIVNKTVIVPVYEEQYDTTALRIYREAMPGYNVVGIECNDIIGALGAIHCITKEIGVDEPVWISYAPILHAYVGEENYPITAQIKSASGIESAWTYWSSDTATGYHSLEMSPLGTDSFRVEIPAQLAGTKIFYYISATSNNGRIGNKPLVVPTGVYTFTVETASEISDARTQVSDFYLAQNYPNPFNPSTVISYQLSAISQVNLTVFNALGQEVRKLVNRRQEAGKYSVSFNADGLASGVYFIKFQSGQFAQTKKMILLR